MSHSFNIDKHLTSIAASVAKVISEDLTGAGIRCVTVHAGSAVQHPNLVRTFKVHEGDERMIERQSQTLAAVCGANLASHISDTLKRPNPGGNSIVVFSDFPKPLVGKTARGFYENVNVRAGILYELHEYIYSIGVQFVSQRIG